MSQLSFHPVWECKLTNKQKEEFLELMESLPPAKNDFEATMVRGKHKKNGGVVATVLLRNSSCEPLDIEYANVQIKDKENEVIATECFTPDFFIEAGSTMPWSFVFSKKSVQKAGENPANWQIKVDLQQKKE